MKHKLAARINKTPVKISGIAGILFVMLSFVASWINKTPPAYSEDTSTLQMWFAENGDIFRFGHFLAGVAFLLFYFPFYAGLCEILKEAEGKPAVWTRVTWAGAIMSPAAGTIAGACIMGLALAGDKASGNVFQFGMAANFYAYTIAGAYSGIAAIGVSMVILKSGVFKRWLAWAGLLIGFGAIISTGTLMENDPNGLFAAINGFAWLTYFLWIAMLAFELTRIPAHESD